MTRLRTASLAFVATLALAACNAEEAPTAEVAEGQPVAAVAAPAGQAWSDVASFTPEGGVIQGNPNAPIKLVEYASHTCGHCAEFAETSAEPLRTKYIDAGKVSFELRNQIHDPIDLTVAVLARCTGPQGFHALAEQSWANLPAIFEAANANKAALDAAMQAQGAARFDAIAQGTGLYDFFAQRGVSRDQARTCLANAKTAEQIAANSETQSEELGVTGTPTFFINGTKVGTQTWATLEPMLQRAGAR
ncbi:thioredoxin domain-containing protein [Altererythrobacter sp. TH136]|uniref:thioredoxin domain-containing protein n=1 Tax=Altererythrobacter sp. TH136 TaxID=2067415 RepID=UPI0011651C9F|nr:thioredoxin domain-containing protein [Altererythrobacter sp. TH136]QDM40239.1 protein-disulfide isomerase [Altererythrobacter sp. TH136]